MTPTPPACPGKSTDRIGLPTLLRYGVGQLGSQIFRDTPAVLLPLFLTTLMAVPAWLAGLVVLGPKLWLIVCDPLVGSWSDRLSARFGRMPFLVAGALGTSAGLVALFAIPYSLDPLSAAALSCFTFFLASTAFSLFSVPYLARATELSADPHERTRLMVLRMIFGTLGVLLGVGFSQPMIAWFGGGQQGWRATSHVLALVCLVTMMITALGIGRRGCSDGIPASTATGGLFRQLKLVRSNRPFLVLLSACFLSNIGQASSYTALGFVFLYAIKAVWLIPAFIFTMATSSLLAQMIWIRLPRHLGKPRSYVLAASIWTVVTISWLWVKPGTDVLIQLPGGITLATQHILILIRAVLLGMVNNAFIMLSLSMMTDTVEQQRRDLGVDNAGTYAGLFSAFEKLAFAIGPLIAGALLSAFGFASSHGSPASQSDLAVMGIIMLYSIVPATMQIFALIVFARYKLS